MADKFKYPASDLDRGRALVATLGTFWSRIYSAKDQIQSYTTAVAVLAAQNYRNILETVWSLSRFDVPIFHTEYWVPLVIRKSELTTAPVVNNFFDDDSEKFDLTSSLFNGVARTNLFYFSLPKNLVGLRHVFNKIIYPTVALAENIDYAIDSKNRLIAFTENPFDNPGFLRRSTAVNGKSDEEIVLWGFNGSFDYENVFNQFAYAVGIRLKSSQGFKDLTNAVIDGLISGGATCADLDLALAAVCDIPLTVDDEETVEVVDNDTHGLFVATDKHLYRFGSRAEAIVVPGQKVRAGTQMIRGFEIDEFFVGTTYDPTTRNDENCCPAQVQLLGVNSTTDLLTTENLENLLLNESAQVCSPRKALSALALDNGFLSACFYGDMVFENKELPLHVDTDHVTGYTYVSFPVAGMPQDVQQFFDEIHYRGITAAQNAGDCPKDAPKRFTLAHYLDKRKTPISEPEAQHLPQTINPLRFIVENVLRNNVFVVKLKVSALGKNRLGLYNIRHLRQLLPPGTAMILVVDLEAPTTTIDAEDSVSENMSVFIGAEPAVDTLNDTFIRDLGVTVNLLSGSCQ
ncbi:hypothetical protein EBZ39_00215 [bacterium]|nr:hypothetical protein [bacterium]